ncbi:hypothetical protein [uncultured Croceitalea sp.]|uniref:hypothetical protein n=1 Tax=uncultured Croceitalea sp. TaxID=1798908 RepID=UPI00374F75F0
MKNTTVTIALFLLCWYTTSGQNIFSIHDYYPIADKNEWRYTAPDDWKDGDYISKIEKESGEFIGLFNTIEGEDGNELFSIPKTAKTYRHFDATKASKLLSVSENGISYHGETFASDGSIAVFEKPFIWFSKEEEIGSDLKVARNYIRYFVDGTQRKGTFEIVQKIIKKEDIEVLAGKFKNCLRVEFDTYWDLGEGTEAKSVNVYHYAKDVGVVKASARFIILKNGIEIINRLVEPDLKSYLIY